MARRLTTNQKILGSIPSVINLFDRGVEYSSILVVGRVGANLFCGLGNQVSVDFTYGN